MRTLDWDEVKKIIDDATMGACPQGTGAVVVSALREQGLEVIGDDAEEEYEDEKSC